MGSKRNDRRLRQIVDELKTAAEQLGLKVRVDNGNFRGGRCQVGDDAYVVLNKRHLPEGHLIVLAESLRDLPVDTIYLKPATRQALEEAWDHAAARATDANAEDLPAAETADVG